MNNSPIDEPSIESTELKLTERELEDEYLQRQEERSLVKALRAQTKVKRFGKPTINPYKTFQ